MGLTQDTEEHMFQTEYVMVRDFLVATVALANANRSGVLGNLTLERIEPI